MDFELLFQHFNIHPFLLTLLIITSMFFIAVWLKEVGPWVLKKKMNDKDFLDNEEKNYTISFQQTKINLNSHCLPESIEYIITIKKEEN